jgi:hypothetical protein
MLNGLDPIIIFQLYKKTPEVAATLASIPLTSSKTSSRTIFAIIPIYLSETLTGIYIDSESKNIDIDTDTASLSDGSSALINQKALSSITTINLIAKQNSIGLTILLALSELILDKVTSQEYEITYMHGGVTVFGGLIHSFSYDQGSDNDLYKIKLELSKGRKAKSVGAVDGNPDAVRLGSSGATPPANAPTFTPPAGGSSTSISPGGLL